MGYSIDGFTQPCFTNHPHYFWCSEKDHSKNLDTNPRHFGLPSAFALGGPDTITAYALEDNELWLRHLLGLVVQVGVAFYVFLLSSSAEHFRDSLSSSPDPCQEFVAVVEQDKRGQSSEGLDEGPTRFTVVVKDDIAPKDHNLVQAYFYKGAAVAFKIVAIELGFMYDVFYTKAAIVYSQFISDSAPLLSSCKRWSGSIDKHFHLNWEDVNISNLQKTIFKFLKHHDDSLNDLRGAESKLLREIILTQRGNFTLRSRTWYAGDYYNSWCTVGIEFVDSLVIWHIATDLLYYDDLDGIDSGDVSKLDPKCKVSKYLSDYMLYLLVFCPFMLLQGFSVVRYKEACDEAISLFKQESPADIFNESRACKDLLKMLISDSAPLLSSCKRWSGSIDLYNLYKFLLEEGDVSIVGPKCKVNKYLSDYMLHLLVFCPFMLPQGFGVIRYKEACDEAISLFKQESPADIFNESRVCKDLLKKYPQSIQDVPSPEEMLMSGNESLLKYGCMLSRQLCELTDMFGRRKWKIISDAVWVEMLAYAADNCGWKEHTQQLRNGGEFLTHVYLLMAHFGFSRQYTGRKLIQLTALRTEDALEDYLKKKRERN
ncbi:hypothetical protein JRO89_XS09G0228800 [Xanthoceras sorbifolium]|uniref:DUF4220 domain-containing protein n=1 Tax=Xanthoceras sorbifolium TaxID=99658 RepID=A0ABQ8HMJ0_9ROSI|nr:hypothetical protein JRO89_XS09G0228800 [Xanthoceras sorbifolium]